MGAQEYQTAKCARCGTMIEHVNGIQGWAWVHVDNSMDHDAEPSPTALTGMDDLVTWLRARAIGVRE